MLSILVLILFYVIPQSFVIIPMIVLVANLIFNIVISIKIKDGRILSVVGLIINIITIIYLLWAYAMAGYFSV